MAMTAVSSTVELEELIRERSVERVKKLEKAKQSQEGNLRRIVEMKSAIGVNPLALFPKEIWIEIMDTLSPKDRWSMYQIHPTFQSLLESTKIRDVLFPLALAVVMDQVKKNEVYSKYNWYSFEITNEDEITRSDLLPFIKLRQVSKSLRDCIDRWFEENLLQYLQRGSIPNEDRIKDAKDGPTNMTFQLSTGGPISRGRFSPIPPSRRKELLNELSEDQAAAVSSGEDKNDMNFFLKAIQLVLTPDNFDWHSDAADSDDDDEDWEDEYERDIARRRRDYLKLFRSFRTNIISFLQLYGDQIWYFTLNSDPSQTFDTLRLDVVEVYTFLQQCCELMPNLKWLDVSFYFYHDKKMKIEVLPGERTAFLPNTFDIHPFPKLQNLERIDFGQRNNYAITSSVYNVILEANPQVKTLRLLGIPLAFESLSYPALKALNLESCSFGHRNSIGFDFNIWKQPLMDFSWPLKTLEFRVGSSMEMDWVNLFQPLQQLPTLEKVCLHMKDMKLRIGKGTAFLNLPNLKHFKIEFSPEIDYSSVDICQFFSLNFLLNSKKLQCLVWKTLKTNEDLVEASIQLEDKKILRFMKNHECKEKMLNFMGGMGDLTHSNVWDAFPYLNRMVVSFSVNSEHLTICRRTTKINEYRRFGQSIQKQSKIEFN